MKEKVEILRIKENSIERMTDTVALEIPLTVVVNDRELLTLLCSPDKLEYLAAGFLLSEGIISKRDDIEFFMLDNKTTTIRLKIKNFDEKEFKGGFGRRIITSGCGKSATFFDYSDFTQCLFIDSPLKVKAERILSLVSEFQRKSGLFIETGGVHSAAVSDGEKLLLFAEDLGRHNALDKIFGQACFENIDLSDKLVLTSGRISSEVVIKTLKRGLPILISPSAPTELAVRIARKRNLTVAGFARGKRMNVYSNPERIL